MTADPGNRPAPSATPRRDLDHIPSSSWRTYWPTRVHNASFASAPPSPPLAFHQGRHRGEQVVVSPGPVVRCEHCGGLADLAGMEVWEGLKRWRIHRHHPDENVPHCPFIATTADDAVIAAQVRDGLDTLAALRAKRKLDERERLDHARQAVAIATAVGIDTAEIATLTGYSERTIDGWVHRARRAKRSPIPAAWASQAATYPQIRARELLGRTGSERAYGAGLEQRLSRLAEGAAAWAAWCGIPPAETAARIDYTLGTVHRWYARAEAAQARAEKQLLLDIQRRSVRNAKRARQLRAAQARIGRARVPSKSRRKAKRRRRRR